ncbi:hypothetical protein DL771_010117 [Monosporascus sp. 5C6A]|nr:hypothetical protein DL771_010117 [Monosporascus sp. 5C6A]
MWKRDYGYGAGSKPDAPRVGYDEILCFGVSLSGTQPNHLFYYLRRGMGSGKMDEKAAKRIADARGKKDPFAKRADLAARNNRDRAGSGVDAWRKGDPSAHKDNRRAK